MKRKHPLERLGLPHAAVVGELMKAYAYTELRREIERRNEQPDVCPHCGEIIDGDD